MLTLFFSNAYSVLNSCPDIPTSLSSLILMLILFFQIVGGFFVLVFWHPLYFFLAFFEINLQGYMLIIWYTMMI